MPVQLSPHRLGSGSQVLENRARDAERPHQPEEVWSANCWYPLEWLGIRMPVVWSMALLLHWVELRETHGTSDPQFASGILKWWEISLKCTFLIILHCVSLELKRHWGAILFLSFGDMYHICFSCAGPSSEINCKKNVVIPSSVHSVFNNSGIFKWFLCFLNKILLFSCFWLWRKWIQRWY